MGPEHVPSARSVPGVPSLAAPGGALCSARSALQPSGSASSAFCSRASRAMTPHPGCPPGASCPELRLARQAGCWKAACCSETAAAAPHQRGTAPRGPVSQGRSQGGGDRGDEGPGGQRRHERATAGRLGLCPLPEPMGADSKVPPWEAPNAAPRGGDRSRRFDSLPPARWAQAHGVRREGRLGTASAEGP